MSEENAIYNISWVLPETFEVTRVSIVDGIKVGQGVNATRSKITYAYPTGDKDLLVTVPLEKEALIVCRGVQKSVYTQGDMKVETNRYVAPLVLDANNRYHIELYNVFEQIQDVLMKHKHVQKVTFPIHDVPGKHSIIYANLIHSHDGRMFSTAYTNEKQIDILECKKSLVRPALLLSAIRKSHTEYKIQIQVSQMYVAEEIKDFPLATRNM